MRLQKFWPAVPLFLLASPALAVQPEPAISPGSRAEPVPATAPAGDPAPAADSAEPTEPAEPADAPAEASAEPAPAGDPGPFTPTSETAEPVSAPPAGSQPPASAAPSPPPLPAKHRLVYSNLLALRVNPLGAEDRFTLGYQYRLYNKASPLFSGAYFGIAFAPTFSPSITRIGFQVDLAPLTILRLRGGYYLATWYGSQRFKAHDFSTPTDAYGPDQIKERADRKEGISTFGGQAELGALFQIKIKAVAVRNELTAYHNNIRLPVGSDVFYDLRHDALVPARGWFLTNDSDLLYVTKFGLSAGVRNSLVHVFYPAEVYSPGQDASVNPNTPMDRLGPVLAYTFWDRPEKRFNKPTLIFAAQWWLLHRFRGPGPENQIHPAIPLFLLGFSFTGDLVKSKH